MYVDIRRKFASNVKISLWYVGPIYPSYRRFKLTVVLRDLAVAGDDYRRFGQVIGEHFETRNVSPHWEFEEKQPALVRN